MSDIPLLVPVIEEKSVSLHKILVKGESSCPMMIMGVTDKNFKSKLETCLKIWHPEATFDFEFTIEPNHELFMYELTTSTYSVFLGLFLQAYRYTKHLFLKTKWDSIIVTGDLISHDNQVYLQPVGGIEQGKFEGVKEYALAKDNRGKKHLFLCVSNEKHAFLDCPENLEIKQFASNDSLNAIIAEVFEFKPAQGEQSALFDKSNMKRKWDYVSTTVFEKMKHEALNKDWDGFFIHGEGETGKSALAYELAKYLAAAERIYAPIWVKIENEDLKGYIKNDNPSSPKGRYKKTFLSASVPKKNPLENKITAYIAQQIAQMLVSDWEQEKGLPTLAEILNQKKYLLIIDNLEFTKDEVDEVIEAVQIIIKECRIKPPVIFTSRVMGTISPWPKIRPSELSTAEIEKLVWDIARKQGEKCLQVLAKEKGKQEYENFFAQLYTHFASFPGIIEVIVPQLEIKGLPRLLQILGDLSLLGDSTEKKAENLYKTIFQNMDKLTQAVLFAFIGITEPWMGFGYDQLLRKHGLDDSAKTIPLEQKILSKISELDQKYLKLNCTTAELEEKIEKSLDKLVYLHVLNHGFSKTTNQSDRVEYYIKSLTLKIFLFSNSFANRKSPASGKTLREMFIHSIDLIIACIRLNQSRVQLEKLLKKNEDTECKNYFFIYTASMYSAVPGHIDALVAHGYKDIDKPIKKLSKRTPLHFAAYYNPNKEVLERLLYHGAKVSSKDTDGRTPLHRAARNNRNPEIITLLHEKNTKIINIPDKGGELPLHSAIWNDNPDVFKCVVKLNPSALHIADANGFTPLFEFIMSSNDPNIAPWLKECNIDFNTRSPSGATLLHCAAFNDSETILKKLIEAGADIKAIDNEGATVLHYAAMNSELDLMTEDMITILLNNGLDINATTSTGGTPLHIAAAYNDNPDSVALLLEKGAKSDINAKAIDGGTPLHCAAVFNEEPDVISLLIENGANIDALADNNVQPIHSAAANNPESAIIEVLLKNKADVNAQNKDGATPLHYAAKYNENPDICKALIIMGEAKLNKKDNSGKTALSYLKKREDWPLIKTAMEEAGITL